jgi:hypothetical protein
MGWTPASEEQLEALIDRAEARMSAAQRRLWQAILIPPARWHLHPWGDQGGGFWAVGVIGRLVVWYNDIEEGFNRSVYARWGVIDGYWCDQDELESAVQHVLTLVETGIDRPRHGPP